MQDLAGRRIAITGGLGDIAVACAQELDRRGATLTLFDVADPADAADRLPQLKSGTRPGYAQVDVRDRDAVDRAIDAVERLDTVIACAAVVESAPFLDITAAQWAAHMNVNLTGCFHTGQAAARRFVAEGRSGQVLFMSSWVQDVAWPEIGAYAVSKSGLKGLVRTMARELAAHGIRVNAVAPGVVDAGMARRQIQTEPRFAARVAKVIPLGELQTAEQVAEAVGFMCSPAAAYATGSVLLVDGGCSLFQFDTEEPAS